MIYTREAAMGEPLFNSSGFERIIEMAGADAVVDLAELFDTEARKRLARIEAAVQAADREAIERETHTLGSSAGTFGLQRIHILARAAEAACEDDDVELASSLCRDILEIAEESLTLAATFISAISGNTEVQ